MNMALNCDGELPVVAAGEQTGGGLEGRACWLFICRGISSQSRVFWIQTLS
jgi:hypothetical protein